MVNWDLSCAWSLKIFHFANICLFICHSSWQVIPYTRGSAWEQPPPDLASYLYKNRIVYLGMSLVPSVTELILAEFLYLQYEDEEKPIYLYINSTGTTKVDLLLFSFLFSGVCVWVSELVFWASVCNWLQHNKSFLFFRVVKSWVMRQRLLLSMMLWGHKLYALPQNAILLFEILLSIHP